MSLMDINRTMNKKADAFSLLPEQQLQGMNMQGMQSLRRGISPDLIELLAVQDAIKRKNDSKNALMLAQQGDPNTVKSQNTNLSDPNNNRLNNYQNLTPNQRRVLMSGNQSGGKTKRSVSETKKKYVASQQGWCCKHCSIQLPAWFEVDHVVKLEYGGSNSIDNLEALCRDCHGKKTAMENL